jgi:hypothetical protein
MLGRMFGFERWPVRPPLRAVAAQTEEACSQELHECGEPA